MQTIRVVKPELPPGPTPNDVFKAPGNNWEETAVKENYRKTQAVWKFPPSGTRGPRATRPDFSTVARLEEAHTADATFPEAPQVTAQDWPLRFYGFFLDHQCDGHGTRKVVILFYPEDGTLMISEPKAEGRRGGVLLKRHIALLGRGVAGDPRGRCVTLACINVGRDLVLYGRKYHIVDCDSPTREYLRTMRVTVPAAQPYPEEEGEEAAVLGEFQGAMLLAAETSPRAKSHARYQRQIARPTRQWEDDGVVLRFSVAWDCRGTGGDLLLFSLKFFPSDGTFVLSEELPPNSGMDAFRLAMSRCRLLKGANAHDHATPYSHVPRGTLTEGDFYQASDLDVGKTIHAGGRRLLICDADAFTRDWYRRSLGTDLRPRLELPADGTFSSQRKTAEREESVPALFTAFGTEEDVLGNRNRLVLRPPMFDVRHWERWDGCVLRFSARRNRPPTEDEAGRRFVISFHMADSSVQVAEVASRNAGRSSGRLLRRQKVKKTGGEGPSSFYQWDDFYVGAVVKLCGYGYEVVGMDPATLRFRYHRDRLPEGVDVEAIEDALDRWGIAVGELPSLTDVIEASAQYVLTLNDQTLVRFFRMYNADHGGHVLLREFLTALAGDVDRALEEATPSVGDDPQMLASKEERRRLGMTLKAAQLIARALQAQGLSPQEFFSLIAQLPCTRKAAGAMCTGGLQARANRFQFLSGCRQYLKLQLEAPELEGLLASLFPEARPSVSSTDFTAALAQWEGYGALPPLHSMPPPL